MLYDTCSECRIKPATIRCRVCGASYCRACARFVHGLCQRCARKQPY